MSLNEGINKEIHRKIGEILVHAITVENMLELFIYNYFIEPESSKVSFFNESVIQPLSFEKKRIIFKQICERRGFPDGDINEICNLIRDIQKIRNQVAHSETILNLSTGRKHLVKRIESSQDSLDLDDKFMDDFNKKVQGALKRITYFLFK